MQKLKNGIGLKLPELKRWQCVLFRVILSVVLAGMILLLTLKIQPNDFSYMVWLFQTQPLLILLNFLPAFLTLMLMSALLGNLFYGAAVTEVLFCGFSIANLIKCNVRSEPVYPRDLQILREVGEAVNSYHIDFPMKKIAVVLFLALVLVVIGFVLRKYERKPYGLRGKVRWGHFFGTAVVFLGLIFTVYGSPGLYASFRNVHYFSPMGAYNDLGFPYSFFYYMTANSVDKPSGFDEDTAAQWDNEEPGAMANKDVNVVIVMNESFSDFVSDDVFTYSEEEDPISFYHSMIQREDVLSGHLVVMNLGGGTANTEFDVMTGIQSDSLSFATSVAFRTISRNTDSIFRAYEEAGYKTSYIHPGYAWFYNRNHIMPWFGVDTMTFNTENSEASFLGGYVADDVTADMTIAQFEQDTADGGLCFNYTTTIQNHMNYTIDKYGEDYEIPPLQCSAELSGTIGTELAVYIEGLRYADASLEKQVNYFESCGKPVVFVFFGDHLPYMGEESKGYQELGMAGEDAEYDFSLYAPPYLIWANEEAKEILDWDEIMAKLDLPEYMSACYLGATIAEITGLSESSPWLSFINETRRELPVVWETEYMDSQSNVLFELNAEQAERMHKWRSWSYYRLRCKQIPD